jgi:hypothetical protein
MSNSTRRRAARFGGPAAIIPQSALPVIAASREFRNMQKIFLEAAANTRGGASRRIQVRTGRLTSSWFKQVGGGTR